jgi:hypothetical protein
MCCSDAAQSVVQREDAYGCTSLSSIQGIKALNDVDYRLDQSENVNVDDIILEPRVSVSLGGEEARN